MRAHPKAPGSVAVQLGAAPADVVDRVRRPQHPDAVDAIVREIGRPRHREVGAEEAALLRTLGTPHGFRSPTGLRSAARAGTTGHVRDREGQQPDRDETVPQRIDRPRTPRPEGCQIGRQLSVANRRARSPILTVGRRKARGAVQTAAPTSAPMPEVTAIATAPQTTTRIVAVEAGAAAEAGARVPEDRERDKRHGDADDDPGRRGGRGDRDHREDGAGGEREGRGPGRLERAGAAFGREAELVAGVGLEGVLLGERLRHLTGEGREGRRGSRRSRTARGARPRDHASARSARAQVGLLGIALGADRHVLAGGHREGAGGESRRSRR